MSFRRCKIFLRPFIKRVPLFRDIDAVKFEDYANDYIRLIEEWFPITLKNNTYDFIASFLDGVCQLLYVEQFS